MYKLLFGMALALLLVACEKEKMPAPAPAEKIFNLSGFTRIHAGETYTLTVKQGAVYSVVAKGRNEALNDLVATIEPGNILSVRLMGLNPVATKWTWKSHCRFESLHLCRPTAN